MFYFILVQLFARVQEITLQQIYTGVAYANLRLLRRVLLTYLLTYLPTYLICLSRLTYCVIRHCNSPTRTCKIVAGLILFYC